jgi:hypothetical protein
MTFVAGDASPWDLDALIGNRAKWQAYVPALSFSGGGAPGGASGVQVARYVQVGKLVHVKATIYIDTLGTAAGVPRLSLPVPLANGNFGGSGFQVGGLNCGIMVLGNNGNSGLAELVKAADLVTPLTAGSFLTVSFFYEAA